MAWNNLFVTEKALNSKKQIMIMRMQILQFILEYTD